MEIAPGLTDAEFLEIERWFGFQFADDHRAFLAAGLPVWTPGMDDNPDKKGWGWPNWRELGSATLQEQVDWPLTTALDGIIQYGRWPREFGSCPRDRDRRTARARRLLAEAPRMIPVYAHRYLPAGRGSSGHPVLSIHELTDIIVYGLDLADYIDQEFREQRVTAPFWRDQL